MQISKEEEEEEEEEQEEEEIARQYDVGYFILFYKKNNTLGAGEMTQLAQKVLARVQSLDPK